jgi:hypothetical protein
MKLPNAANQIATPAITLQAGITYTLTFKTRTDQTDSKRRISVYHNQTQSLTGATKFYETFTIPNSYATPPFAECNSTFIVPTTGSYYFIFDYQNQGYLFTYLDEVAIEQTFLPTTTVTSPSNNAVFNESGGRSRRKCAESGVLCERPQSE